MPKNKREFNYRQALIALRPNITFNYSLKGISPDDPKGIAHFNGGQKAAIRRAWKDAQEPKGARLVKVKHLPRESQSHYQKRLREIKDEFGQGGTSIKGIFLEAPKSAKVSYTKKHGLQIEKQVEDGITTMRFFGMGKKEKREFLHSPKKFIEKLLKKYPGTFIAPMHTTWIKRGFDVKTNLKDFITYVKKLLNEYADNIHAMTGFAITRYPFFEKYAKNPMDMKFNLA